MKNKKYNLIINLNYDLTLDCDFNLNYDTNLINKNLIYNFNNYKNNEQIILYINNKNIIEKLLEYNKNCDFNSFYDLINLYLKEYNLNLLLIYNLYILEINKNNNYNINNEYNEFFDTIKYLIENKLY